MYLIKVEMDRRDARHLLADCQQMHRMITGLFGTDRQSSQILYRTQLAQNRLKVYLYAQNPAVDPDGKYDIQQRDVTSWLDGMAAGQLWSFDLVASPSKKVGAEGQKNSRRRILREPAERQNWLERKAEQSGFAILHVEELEQIHVSGRHHADKGGTMYHDAYHYQGTLQITNADAFRSALQNGIGSGKAYGFGMMMVKRL